MSLFPGFHNLAIRNRLLLSLVPPVLLLLFCAALLIFDYYERSSHSARVERLAEITPVVSALIHELQKERGASSGYIGSQGADFADELRAQKRETDIRRLRLLDQFGQMNTDEVAGGLNFSIAAAVQKIGELDGMRGRVVAQQVSAPDTIRYFSATIASLLDVIEGISGQTASYEVSRRIAAYTAFLRAKEQAGQERAVGSAGFGAGRFSNELQERFVRNVSAQYTLLQRFRVFAEREHEELLLSVLADDPALEVARLRAIALSSMTTASTDSVEALHWFTTISTYIDQLKEVEDRVAADLLLRAGELRDEANRALVGLATVVIGALVLSGLLTWLSARGITGPLGDMTRAMTRLADGRTDVELPNARTGGEIGEMARALQVFRENREQVEAMNAERDQVQQELVKQSQAIIDLSTMVLDVRDGVVVVPVIGSLDRNRADRLATRVLERVSDGSVAAVLLDITGVAEVSSEVARFVTDLIRMVGLMGSEVIVTGVRPAVAQTLADSGVDLGAVQGAASLSLGLSLALRHMAEREGPGRD